MKTIDKPARQILREHARLETENKELKDELAFWKTRCKRLDKNLRIFSAGHVEVGDFIDR